MKAVRVKGALTLPPLRGGCPSPRTGRGISPTPLSPPSDAPGSPRPSAPRGPPARARRGLRSRSSPLLNSSQPRVSAVTGLRGSSCPGAAGERHGAVVIAGLAIGPGEVVEQGGVAVAGPPPRPLVERDRLGPALGLEIGVGGEDLGGDVLRVLLEEQRQHLRRPGSDRRCCEAPRPAAAPPAR